VPIPSVEHGCSGVAERTRLFDALSHVKAERKNNFYNFPCFGLIE